MALQLRNFDDISEPSGPKKISVFRPVVLLFPSRNFDASTPSIGRSVGTLSDAPASAANVLYQSWQASISSVTTPFGADLPGIRTIAGARIYPSPGGRVKSPLKGPVEPPTANAGTLQVELSLENTMTVSSAIPACSTQSTICPTRWSISAIRSAYSPRRFGSVWSKSGCTFSGG